MAISVSTGFKLGANMPLDVRTVVDKASELGALAEKYEGMAVYVKEKKSYYVYDADGWKAAPVFYDPDGGSTVTYAALGGIAAGTDLGGKSCNEILKQLLLYTKPTITLSGKTSAADISGAVFKAGTTQQVTFTVTVEKKTNPITAVTLYSGSVPTALNAAAGTQTAALSVSSDTVFKATVSDGSSTVTSSSLSCYFVKPMYIGAVASAPASAEEITALTEKIVRKTAKCSLSFKIASASDKGRYCFAYPAAYGTLAKILDQNGFDNTAAWGNAASVEVDGTPYYVYTYGLDNFNAEMTFTFTFGS